MSTDGAHVDCFAVGLLQLAVISLGELTTVLGLHVPTWCPTLDPCWCLVVGFVVEVVVLVFVCVMGRERPAARTLPFLR